MRTFAVVFVFCAVLLTINFGGHVLANSCPSCIDADGGACNTWGSGRAFFQWASGEDVSSSIVLTAGECDNPEPGETGKGYIFAAVDIHDAVCNGNDNPCGVGYPAYGDYYAIIEITGNKKAFEHIFPDGISFQGDYPVYPYGGGCYYKSITVDRVGCKYALPMGGGQTHHINLSPTVSKCNAQFDDSRFNISVEFFQEHDGNYARLASTSGSMTVKRNPKRDFDPVTFKPDLKDGTGIGWIEKISRDYDEGGDSEWSLNYKTGYTENCYWDTAWAAFNSDCGTVIPDSDIFYRVKFPGWKEPVNGQPAYIGAKGWGYVSNATDRYIKYDMGDLGAYYFHCDTPATDDGTTTKYYISEVEYCQSGTSVGNGETKWTCVYEYNSPAKLKYIYNGHNTTDPNSISQATTSYVYTWGGDGNDPNVIYQSRNTAQDDWTTERQWLLEFDSLDRAVKFQGGCGSCGGSSDFEHIEYYGSTDLISKRYNATGDPIVENTYGTVDYGEIEPVGWLYISNYSFELPDITGGTSSNELPTGWDWIDFSDDSNMNIYIHDPNDSTPPDGSQVLQPNGDGIEYTLPARIYDDMLYLLEAEIKAIPGDSATGTATISLYTTDTYVDVDDRLLAQITFTEGVDANEGIWTHGECGWDSSVYEDEPISGSFSNDPQFRVEVSGVAVEIDEIRLSAARYYYQTTKNILTEQKTRNDAGSLVTTLKRTIDEDAGEILEYRYSETGKYRLTKLKYENDYFANLTERIEYGDVLTTSDPVPETGYTTEYTVYDPNGHYTTTYPSGERADYERYTNGNLVESYVIDVQNDANSLNQQFTYELKGNAWRLTEQVNPRSGVTEYSYQQHSYPGTGYTYLLEKQTDPNNAAGQQEVVFTYDGAQRVLTETRKLDSERNLRTSYDYNETTGFLDSLTVNGATTHFYHNTFDQVIRQINPDGIITGKSYGLGGELVSEFVISENTADPNGADTSLKLISQTRYTYTDDGKIETVGHYKSDSEFDYQSDMTSANWIVTKHEYYANGRKKKTIEDYGTGRTNLTTEFSYNYQGEVAKVTYPTGKWTRTTRDGRGLVVLEETGHSSDTVVLESAYSYDNNGNLQQQSSPDGSYFIYTYDNYDRLKRTYTGSLSGPYTERFYNNAGDVIREIACEADGTVLSDNRSEYDDLGNVIFERLCFEPNSIDNDSDFTSHFEYDIAGNLRFDIKAKLASSEPNAITTEFIFDNQGRKQQTIDPKGWRHSVYYTDSGLVKMTVDPNDPADPNAFITENIFDPYGRIEKTIDPMGHYTVNTYNSLNQITKQVFYDCKDPNTPDDDVPVRQMRTEYDNLGNITCQAVMADPNETGSIVPGTDLVTDYVFDSSTGLLYQQKNYYGTTPTTATTTFTYDSIGRREKTTDPVGNWEKVYYETTDESKGSQVVKVEQYENDPDGSNDYTITTFFEYDIDGRLEKNILDTNGNGVKESTDQETLFDYDGLGRIETETANDDVETFTAYDGFGNVKLTIEDYVDGTPDIVHDRKTEFIYNRLNQQYQVKAYDPNDTTEQISIQTTTYEFDDNGNVSKIIYPDNEYATYEYGAGDKLITEIKRDGTWIAYWHDWNGNLVQVSDYDADDPNCPNSSASFVELFEYNGVGDLTSAEKVEGQNAPESSFTYNGFGARTSETAQYDAGISKTTTWTVDGSGNTLTQTHGNTTLTYTHDGLGRIKTINKGDDQIVTYDYIGRNTEAIDYPEADATQLFAYDGLGRITDCNSIDANNEPILLFQYTYDSVGNRDTCKYNHLATPVYDVYEYDSLRRLEKVTYADDDGYVALNITPDRLSLDDLSFFASAWLDDKVADLAGFAAYKNKALLSNRLEQMEGILKEAGFRNIDAFVRSAKGIEIAAYDPDAPIYTLVEFGDEVPNNYRSETVYNDDKEVIAQFIWDNKDRMVLFVMYPDVGGTVVITTTYDSKGEVESKIFMILDEDGNITHTEDMLLAEQQAALEAESMSAAPMSMENSSIMMSGVPEAPESGSEEFIYDHLGNRYQYIDKLGYTTTYAHNSANQYSQSIKDLPYVPDEVQNFTYSKNGNLESDGYTYTYDYRNRMIEVEDSNSVTFAEYQFDAFGRRISKTIGSDTVYFFYDTGGRVIAEYDDSTTPVLQREYVYGNGIDEVLAMFNHPELTTNPDDWDEFIEFIDAWLCEDPNDACYDATYDDNDDDIINLIDFAAFADVWEIYPATETRYYYLRDALGSTRGLIGGRYKDPNDYEFYNYDVYGKLSVQDGEESQSGNPYLFTGCRFDAEIGLYHTEHRSYNPDTGRWMQFDPKGYIDTMDLYEYVASNPIMYIDPYGTNLYAIGGTCERRIDNFNVAKMYNYYMHDNGAKVGIGKKYWDGPATSDTPVWKHVSNTWTSITGTSAPIMAKKIKKKICEDYCENEKMQINLVGWSRGASISLEIASMLEKDGCDCKCGNVKPSVNWMGLFDAVEMTVGSSMEENVPSIVTQADHAKRTAKAGNWGKQLIFPRVSGKADDSKNTIVTTRKFYGSVKEDKKHGNRNYQKTTHGDIGTEYPALRWMMKRAENAGLKFDWDHYRRDRLKAENVSNNP